MAATARKLTMNDKQQKNRQPKGLLDRLKDRLAEVAGGLIETVTEAFAPPPQLVPIPIRKSPYQR